ncbi:SMC-Scp complex subunit ScpB [Thiofilum flexile]|uniref:SMC-Scp complex subunit ScpB n=1 Tax=Thiofilum flexile TaxID=125627 RepID=UPI00037106F1|nr:SMC-Scp complex subunit ScpB [Thiofilum flexile]
MNATINHDALALILEAILLSSDKSLSLEQLEAFFSPDEQVTRADVRQGLTALRTLCAGRSFELKETVSGFRLQTRAYYQPWVQRHFEEKPAKYSRALLETLALIAWRQPITRAEIEEVRGVAVNPAILKTLQERDWIRVLGHKEVPGRPALWGTTRQFLDYFNLRSLDELPSLEALSTHTLDELVL